MDGFLINLQDEKETSLQAEEIHQTTDGLVTPKSVHLDTVTKTETKTKTNTPKYKTRLLEMNVTPGHRLFRKNSTESSLRFKRYLLSLIPIFPPGDPQRDPQMALNYPYPEETEI